MSPQYITNNMLTMPKSKTCIPVILGALLTVILHIDRQTNQIQAATSISQAAIVSSLREAAKINCTNNTNDTKNDTNGDKLLKQKQWTLNGDIESSESADHVEKSVNRIVLLSTDENNDDIGSNSISSSHRHQQEYACGRAIANTKYRDNSLLRDNRNFNHLNKFANSNGPRAKYRPTEIRMPRIIGGDETLPGEFPWTVSIKLNGQPICGGSLINRSWILTAAHCVVGYNPKNLTVRLGAYRIKDLSESQTIDLPLSLFIVHRDYSMPRPFSNDIALLKIVQPLEYTDYIIPICLPTEDQVVTSTSSMIVTDYTQKFNGITKDSDLPISTNNDEDTGGVVISTRMSDNEIAQCFDRLERNYLNSIGLAPIVDPVNGSTEQQEPGAVSINAPKPSTSSTSSSSVALPPTLAAPTNTLFPYGSASSLVDPIFMTTSSASTTDKDTQNSIHRTPPTYVGHQHLQTHYNGKPLTLIPSQHNKLAEQHFEPITTSVSINSNGIGSTFGSHQSFPARRPSASSSYHISSDHISQDNGIDNSEKQNHYTYYGLHWGKRMATNSNSDSNQQQEQQSRRMDLPVVKLRLPMSKELLHEIESVGSGSMPALDLDPSQQNELAAMAEDLSSAAAAERERVIQYGSGSVRGTSSSSQEQMVRTSLGSEPDEPVDLNDDPTKYSGLSGTVVGWGWVRELDGDIDQTNKGYPSVTLQKVKLPILRNSICEAWFQSQAKKITLLPSQFCAGFNSGGKDACRGDSGGPMIIEDNSDTGRYKLIGIVSAGIGCARPSLPGLYTRVASFLPWINAQIRKY